jgi:hypothetical protein
LERSLGAAAVAVLWPDRCVLRRWSGLRLDADTSLIPQCSTVPSVLFSAIARKPVGSAPATVEVLAGANVPATMAITLTWGAPSRRYAAEPPGQGI